MSISYYRKQRIILLARLNLGLASQDQLEIELYNHYQKNTNLKKDLKRRWYLN